MSTSSLLMRNHNRLNWVSFANAKFKQKIIPRSQIFDRYHRTNLTKTFSSVDKSTHFNGTSSTIMSRRSQGQNQNQNRGSGDQLPLIIKPLTGSLGAEVSYCRFCFVSFPFCVDTLFFSSSL